jgi:cytochrome c
MKLGFKQRYRVLPLWPLFKLTFSIGLMPSSQHDDPQGSRSMAPNGLRTQLIIRERSKSMLKKRMGTLVVVFLVFGIVTSALAGDHPTKDDVVKFVEEGKAYAAKNGRDAFFKELMNPAGKFKRGELYFYAYDFKGVVLAHGAKPHLVGKNLYNLSDKSGKKLIQELARTAKNGTGWVEYHWQNPTSKKVEKKLGYVVKLDDTSWFGSGTYAE